MNGTEQGLLDALKKCPLVPVLTITQLDSAGDLALALNEAGLTTAEVTLRTDIALDAINVMKKAAPDLIVGAGTILTKADARNALAVGCDFIVTPATTPTLLDALSQIPVPVFPGVATPGEALRALEAGFAMQKFFPAESNGGVKALKSIAAPMSEITFIPTGGIDGSTVEDYLSCPNAVAVGGSWMVDRKAVAAKDWKAVVSHTKAAVEAIKG